MNCCAGRSLERSHRRLTTGVSQVLNMCNTCYWYEGSSCFLVKRSRSRGSSSCTLSISKHNACVRATRLQGTSAATEMVPYNCLEAREMLEGQEKAFYPPCVLGKAYARTSLYYRQYLRKFQYCMLAQLWQIPSLLVSWKCLVCIHILVSYLWGKFQGSFLGSRVS